MKDIEIRNLAQRFGITSLLTSKHQTEQFFSFAREVEQITRQELANIAPPTGQEAVGALRRAMNDANIEGEQRAYLVGFFSNEWNKLLGTTRK
jgi:hypothetical protein